MIDRSSRGPSAPRALRAICLVSLAALATGCASKGERADRPDNPFRPESAVGPASSSPKTEKVLKLEASEAYKLANASMVASDYENALKRYSLLIARYPFSEYSTQAELEKIFVQYRSLASDEALLAADRFLREHPRHVNADYVQYLKGLINSSRTESLSDFLPIDSSKKDVTGERRAYDDFAVLLQRYPNSAYAGDARRRMIYLRNRVASHELSVVRYYVKRQAWVAVSKRAENLIAEYPGSPATADALKLLKLSYQKLGLKSQLDDLELMIASNAASIAMADAPPPKPLPRTDITQTGAKTSALPPASAAKPEAAAAAAVAEKPKGLLGRVDATLDPLNKSYTLDDKKDAAAADAPTAAAPAGAAAGISANPTSNQPGAASLSTGPYTGEPTVINVAPVFADGEKPASAPTQTQAPTQVPATAEAAATDAAAPAKKKEKAGFFDFLNKSYTIGDKKTAAEPAPEAAAPAPAAEASPPAEPVPAAN